VGKPAEPSPLLLHVLLLLSALGVLLSWGTLAVVHLNDAHHLDTPSGVSIGLAYYLNQGRLYPEVFDGATYGGTRHMPLFFTCQAGLARLTGEYLFAGKLLSLLAATACGALLFFVLRHQGCPASVALALPALAAADTVGFAAGTNVRVDLLAALWQVAALAVAGGRRSRSSALLAAGFCVLGVLTKVNSLWAPLGILCYSWRRDRRWCALFAVCWVCTLAVAAALLHFGTSGRMLANFRVIAEPLGTLLPLLLKSPFRLLLFIAKDSPLLFLLTPLVAAEFYLARAGRRLTAYHYGLFFCVPLLLITFTDRGTVSNHLIDLVLLAVLLVGNLWKALEPWRGPAGSRSFVMLVVLWGLWGLWAGNLGHASRDLLLNSCGGLSLRPYKPLEGLIADDEAVLSEVTLVSVARGRPPVVLDSYTFAYLARSDPAAVQELAERVRRKEFTHVVLRERVDLNTEEAVNHFRIHFGPTVRDALRAAYRFERDAEGLSLFVPRDE
jgi:hypothetical protein